MEGISDEVHKIDIVLSAADVYGLILSGMLEMLAVNAYDHASSTRVVVFFILSFPEGKHVALEKREWGQISVISIHSRSGSIMGPPAERA